MGRKYKGVEVDAAVHHRLQVRVPIYFVKSEMRFYAEYLGKQYENTDGVRLRIELMKVIEERSSVEWQGVVVANQPSPFMGRAEQHWIGLDYTRLWIGKTNEGRVLEAPWESIDHPSGRLIFAREFHWNTEKDGPFKPPCQQNNHAGFNDRRGSYFLPYTDELWAGLEIVAGQIDTLRERLRDMLGSEAGLDFIAQLSQSGGTLSLPPAAQTLQLEAHNNVSE